MPFFNWLKQYILKAVFFIRYNQYAKQLFRRLASNPKMREFMEKVLFGFSFRLKSDFWLVHMISLETITACNLRCSYCPNSVYDRGLLKNKKLMTIELFHKIIDELAELGWAGQLQPHLYGEPLLDSRIIEFVKYAKMKIKKVCIDLYSNGELLTVPLYQELVKAGVDIFTITQHRDLPPEGVLDVIAYREKVGSDNVGFSFCKLKPDDLTSRGGIIKTKDVVKKGPCSWPIHNISVDSDGNVLICCEDYLGQVKIGNVREKKLIDIWNDSSYRKIRKDINNGIFEFDLCKKCKGAPNTIYKLVKQNPD